MDRLGWWLLLGALGCCVLAAGVPRRATALLRLAGALTVAAFAALAWAFVTADYRLAEVADYSRRAVVWPLRLAGAWGGMDGSLLLWTALLAAVAAVAARGSARGGRIALAVVVGTFVALSAIASSPFERLASPPLDGGGLTPILEYPAMVVHPPVLYLGLVLSMVAWADVVGLGLRRRRSPPEVADRELERRRRGRARRWNLASWTVLTAGLVLGSLWAYVEVGWGGFWGWDPVENAALLPWFTLLAALHARPAGLGSARVRALLDGLPFVTVLLAATLTRSGWLSSVHAFAEGRAVGWWLLALTIAAALALALAAGRRPSAVEPSVAARAGVDWRVAGTVALGLGSAAVVGLGTVWPFVADLVGGRPRATGGGYYAAWAGPAAVVACGLLAAVAQSPTRQEAARPARAARLAPLTSLSSSGGCAPGPHPRRARWRSRRRAARLAPLTSLSSSGGCAPGPHPRRARWRPRRRAARLAPLTSLSSSGGCAPGPHPRRARWRSRRRAARLAPLTSLSGWWPAGAGALVAVLLTGAAGWRLVPSGLLAGTGALGLVAVTLAAYRRRWAPGPTLAHLGLVVLVLGLAGSTAAQSVTATLLPGQSVRVGPYRVVDLGVSADAGPAGSGGRVVADLVVTRDGSDGWALRPELVAYPARGRLLAETAGRQGLIDDVRVALRSADDDGRVTLEVHVRPLLGAVWVGGVLLAAGGLIALLGARGSARRHDPLTSTDEELPTPVPGEPSPRLSSLRARSGLLRSRRRVSTW